MKRYAHVLRAVEDRPWALLPSVLAYMVDLAHFRADGGVLGSGEIERRLAAAREDNGDRSGAGMAGPVAIVPVYGILAKRMSLMAEMSGGTSYDELESDIAELVNDPKVASIVLDIDSPGGEVDGLPEFAAFLRRARDVKPIVAQVDTLAASAAYWIASQASEVVVTPSGEVGSIGVYTAHQDMSGAMEREGVRTTLVSAGKYKVEGNPYEPLGDEARVAIQDHVDEFYAMFVGDVAKGRNTSTDTVTATYGEGRTLLAKAALAAGMVDRIDTLEATVRRLQPKQTRPRLAAVPTPSKAAAAAATPAPVDWGAIAAQVGGRSKR